jgi:hypothetical integral membrane protein (TIGR02206 family)
MRRSSRIFIALGLSLLAGVQVSNSLRLLARDGARIAWPEPGSSQSLVFTASGDAWMAPGPSAIASIRVEARPAAGAAREPLSAEEAPLVFAAERAIVRGGRGAAPFALPYWTARIELPDAGPWTLRATATAGDGRSVSSEPRLFSVAAPAEGGGQGSSGFSAYTPIHFAALAAVALLVAAVALIARRGGEAWLGKAAPFLALALWGNEIAYQCYWMVVGGWSIPLSLMLQMCGLSIVLLPVCMMMENGRGRRLLGDVLYFWGLGGAIQALLTPDIGASGFPSYRFFSFFLSHGLIVASVAALVASRAIRIDARSLLRCLVVTNVVIVPIYLVDRLLVLVPPYAPGNFFMIGYPPPTGSPIDIMVSVFGPSPRYLAGLEIMGLAVFSLLWLPWGLAEARRRRARVAGTGPGKGTTR